MKKLSIVIIIVSIITGTSTAQRKVLIEQFTNSGCPPCAGNTPVVASYVNAHSDSVLMLSYHTSFPYTDSMYFENATLSNSRVGFYSVTGVPTSRVDGNYFAGNLVPVLSTTLPPRIAIPPQYRIRFINSSIVNFQINTSIQFESLVATNQNEPLVAQIVVAEKRVLKSSYLASPGANTETEYPWVVRYMLPDENGSVLTNTQLGGIDDILVSRSLNNIKDISEVQIIAFVQNLNTKEIYQSEISAPALMTQSIGTDNDIPQFSIYPSPANERINIQINNPGISVKIKVIDVLGNIIHACNADNSVLTISTSTYESGIYFIQIDNGIFQETKRFIIEK